MPRTPTPHCECYSPSRRIAAMESALRDITRTAHHGYLRKRSGRGWRGREEARAVMRIECGRYR